MPDPVEIVARAMFYRLKARVGSSETSKYWTWEKIGPECRDHHLANAQAAILALREAGLLMDWRPIAEAPRDGTHVLIAFGSDWRSSAIYCLNEYDPHPWKFVDQQSKGVPIFNGARDDKYGPTHFMLLPKPPGEIG